MTPESIATRIRHLEQGTESATETLRIVPLIGDSASQPDYRLLDEETIKKVQISEIDQEGSVPELTVDNKLEVYLLLLAGQELVGAKQNRVLDSDVLVLPQSKQKLPVSCVEQGRWGYRSPKFAPGKMSHRSMRARKSADIAESLRERRGHRADQAAVWDEVAAMDSCLDIASPTVAMHDAYEKSESELDRVRSQLKLPDDSVGFAFFMDDHFRGLDVFDRHSSMDYYWKSLIDSYVLDWIRARRMEVQVEEALDAPLGTVLDSLAASDWTEHESPGEGTDYRLQYEGMTGSALVWEERSVIHVQVFPFEKDDRNPNRWRPPLRHRY